jgi:hypothetical protein
MEFCFSYQKKTEIIGNGRLHFNDGSVFKQANLKSSNTISSTVLISTHVSPYKTDVASKSHGIDSSAAINLPPNPAAFSQLQPGVRRRYA